MQIKSKAVMNLSLRKKKSAFLYRLICTKEIFLTFVFYLNICVLLHTLSKYIYFYISKNITSYNFLLVFKIVESLQCILKTKTFWFKSATGRNITILFKNYTNFQIGILSDWNIFLWKKLYFPTTKGLL